MRIGRLDLIRYGRFSDTAIEFPRRECDFHIVFGPNEAGKSTTRAAISDLIFGFEHRSRFDFRFEAQQLRVGALIQAGDREFTFRRRRGRVNTVHDLEGKPVPDATLAGFLEGRTREFFERLFSLDQEALVKGGRDIVEARDELGRMLFQSAAGLGGLGEALKRLEAEAEMLWGSRASDKRAYSRAEKRLQEADKTLREVTLRASAYREAVKKHADAKDAADANRRRGGELRKEQHRLQRVQMALPRIAERADCQQRLKDMGAVIDLPDDAAVRLAGVREKKTAAEERMRLLEATIGTKNGELEMLSVDDDLLAAEQEIRRLQELRSLYSNHKRDIDRREGEIRELRKQVNERAAELGWATGSDSELAERLPSRLVTSRLQGLAQAHGTAAAAVKESKKSLDAKRTLISELEEKLAAMPEATASADLARAVASAVRLGAADERHAELSGAVKHAEAALQSAMAALRPWSGTPHELSELVPPTRVRLAGLKVELDAAELDLRQAKESVRLKKQELEKVQLHVQQVRRDGRPVTSEELVGARAVREQVWRSVRQGLEAGDIQVGRDQIEPFEAAQARTDELADRRFDLASESADLVRSIQDGERLALEVTAAEGLVGEREAAVLVVMDELQKVRAAVGWPDAAVREIEQWTHDRDIALERLADLAAATDTLGAFERQLEAACGTLRGVLGAAAALITGTDPGAFTTLLQAANERQRADQDRDTRRQTLRQQLLDAQREEKDADERFGEAKATLDVWRKDWAAACAAMGFKQPLAVEQATAAVDLVQELRSALEKINDIQTNRIDAMNRDLGSFATDVEQLSAKVAPDLTGQPASELVAALGGRLAKAKDAAKNKERLDREIRDANDELEKASNSLDMALSTVRPLLALSAAEDLEALAAAVSRSEAASHIRDEIDRLDGELLEAGNGLSVTELEAEAASHDRDAIAARLKEIEDELDQLDNEQQTVGGRLQAASTLLATMQGGDAASLAAETRELALADMGAAVQRWTRLKVGIGLLRAAMERYRELKQAPLLMRAQSLFTTLTLNEFKGLRIDQDRADHPVLTAIRQTEEAVPLEGLSNGTADQLFLALRIAALEEYLATAPSLPFVVDDLFVNFDDERAAAGFKVLGELAHKTQVLFFTHHVHLARVAADTLGGRFDVRLG